MRSVVIKRHLDELKSSSVCFKFPEKEHERKKKRKALTVDALQRWRYKEKKREKSTRGKNRPSAALDVLFDLTLVAVLCGCDVTRNVSVAQQHALETMLLTGFS